MIWTAGQQSLQEFISHLNSCHDSIKFTAEISTKSVNFLDTTIYLKPTGSLEVDLYTKPTDSHNYLLFTSAHPQHCKISLPYSQFLRVRRICSTIENYDKHSMIMAKHFKRRGYPQDIIENSCITARRQDRDKLLYPDHTTHQQTQEKLYLITKFEPDWDGLKKIVQKNWDFLLRSNDTKHLHEKKLSSGIEETKT